MVTKFLKDPVHYTKVQMKSQNHILNFVIVMINCQVTEPCVVQLGL